MHKVLFAFFIAVSIISCSSSLPVAPINTNLSTISSNTNLINTPEKAVKEQDNYLKDKCQEWIRIYNFLSEESKKSLKEEWVVFDSSDSEYQNGYYVLSPELVSKCKQRIEIGRLIWRVIRGSDTKADRQFAAQHSQEIVKVLRHIWSSPNFSRDGVSEDKYYLLNYQGIKKGDMTLLLTDIIKVKEINFGLLNELTRKPLSGLKPVILESLKEAENKGDLTQQIAYLIILQQMSSSQKYLSTLEKIRKEDTLEEKIKTQLKKVINDFKAGRKFKADDTLSLGLLDAEQDKNPE